MTLIKSISGIRGTIGGKPGDALTPIDIAKFTLAFGTILKQKDAKKIVVGRDARVSGEMVHHIIIGNLISIGLDVIDLGLATTPTVEMAVTAEQADGGIIITASHNPKQWNALKLLNNKGEFISEKVGQDVLKKANSSKFEFVDVDKLGQVTHKDYLDYHIQKILEIPYVNVEAIQAKQFKVVVDAVNSVGGIAVPALLKALGVEAIHELYCEPNGKFAHNPEPLPENLSALCSEVKQQKADVGIAVDPDVDRLALIDEKGIPFGEEYTLVSVADYVLQHKPGNTVSNLSSTKALRDISRKHKVSYTASAVGEVNVVEKMKATNAVVGGEGNGGIILPELHYGRDALVGIALFLSHLATSNKSVHSLRAQYPNYVISKNKIQLEEGMDLHDIIEKIKLKYKQYPQNTIDGLRIDIDEDWVHLRGSNTEPIIRIYAESSTEQTANAIANKMQKDITTVLKEK
ncbi:MAG TPA: phosphoglucosamine mutase [Chitinophagales bacterium]|nr:phosphoglucosamine mutase [Chitinophagales bacterium]HMW11548.1 phosphoglucosamine mutase [Chitinophagales bacterium]HMX59234.1 phosphoglucosamine mutase [Chitinophagales bacterium]HMY23499.1 phosphoglucosamine mutase [Chitinophagales bacterium]HMZ32583.1 phosphoglucosamine mutase [Chitinophagales bacterium]